MGCHALHQGIFSTERLDPHLLSSALQADSLLLSHQGCPCLRTVIGKLLCIHYLQEMSQDQWCHYSLYLTAVELTKRGEMTSQLTANFVWQEARAMIKEHYPWTSLVVQQLRLVLPMQGSIPGQGTRSHVLQLRVYLIQIKDLACCKEDRWSRVPQLRPGAAKKPKKLSPFTA